jgi:hypothetical protein
MLRLSDRGVLITFGVLSVICGTSFFALLFDVRANGSQLAFCNAVGCRYTLSYLVAAGVTTAFCLFVFVVLLFARKGRHDQ